jgi:ADP-ribose pyrophosphatase YjhB (NUDIX family)
MVAELDAVVVALYSDGKVVLVKKDDVAWGFPGGMLQVGERHGKGAKRKVLEETGLDIENYTLEILTSFKKRPGHTIHLFGVQLGVHAFSHLNREGPNGHILLAYPAAELRTATLRPAHKKLLDALAKKKSGKRK